MFNKMLQMRIIAYFIGRPSWRNLAKGKAVSVSNAIITILSSISKGLSEIPAKAASGALNIQSSDERKMVETNREILAVL